MHSSHSFRSILHGCLSRLFSFVQLLFCLSLTLCKCGVCVLRPLKSEACATRRTAPQPHRDACFTLPKVRLYRVTIKRVVHHMAIHRWEPDFHVICGVDRCTMSYRCYFAYKQHVYRSHRKAAGVVTAASGDDAARNGENDVVEMHSS